jgi:hypothetical protein
MQLRRPDWQPEECSLQERGGNAGDLFSPEIRPGEMHPEWKKRVSGE